MFQIVCKTTTIILGRMPSSSTAKCAGTIAYPQKIETPQSSYSNIYEGQNGYRRAEPVSCLT